MARGVLRRSRRWWCPASAYEGEEEDEADELDGVVHGTHAARAGRKGHAQRAHLGEFPLLVTAHVIVFQPNVEDDDAEDALRRERGAQATAWTR
jgi:hypothetical protein